MKHLLRLGCAFLACAGIAASRAASAPVEGTPAHRRSPEAIAEAAAPKASGHDELSLRPVRPAGPSFRSVASVAGGSAARRTSAFAARSLRAPSRSRRSLLVGRASPRGPPASA